MAETDGMVRNNTSAGRFEIDAEGGLARLDYRRSGNRLRLVHTEVPPESEGQGLGGRLMEAAVDFARAEGLRIVPACAFAAGWVERHPEIADVVDTER